MDALEIRQAVVFLTAAGIIIPLFKRARVSPVLGFLLSGIIVGPYGLPQLAPETTWLHYLTISNIDGVRALAELGVVFLLFMIGLELSLGRLWAMRTQVFGLGGLQIVISAAIIGAIAMVFGNRLDGALVLGAGLALSSTAMVVQLLTESGRFGTRVGQGSFAVLLAQDLAIVPILFIAAALNPQAGGSLPVTFALAMLQAALAVLLILGLGRLAVRPVLRLASSTHTPEVFVAATILTVIVTATVTHAAGLSAALGAFLVGLLFAETEFRYDIEVNIEPFKGLLLGLFFMSIGMSIDLRAVAESPGWIALSAVGLIALKAAVTAGLALAFGYTRAQAVEMGLLLGQGGEFGFVVLGIAVTSTLIGGDTAQFMLIVVGASMLMTPLVANLAHRLGRALEVHSAHEELRSIDANLNGHIIVVGFGRTGQLLAELLERQQIVCIAIDKDVNNVPERVVHGASVFVGDASRPAILARLYPHNAAAVAISTDDAVAAERVLAALRNLAPDTPVVLRARDNSHAMQMLARGATQVVPEVQEAGLQLAHLVLEHSGMSADAARELVELRRAELAIEPKR